MEKKTELLKTLEFLTSLGYDNVQGLSIGIKYDEITIRATFDGFSEREKKESEHQSNCNLPQVSGCDGLIEEKIFKLKFPNEEFNIDDYNDWVIENGMEAYQLCLKVIKSSH